jgi:membrane-associated phospholipid phosphatase
MIKRSPILAISLLFVSSGMLGQSTSVESPAAATEPAKQSMPAERPVSWKLLIPNIGHDQKQIWTFPLHAAKGEHWKPTLGFVLATAGLVALDPHDTPYFRRTTAFTNFNKVASGRNTSIATAVVPLSIYGVGLIRKDSYAQNTGLLVGESVVDAEILTTVMKNVDRRLRPSDIPPTGDFTHTWFKSHGTVIGGRGSFPSGHSIAAFSVATIIANRYRSHRWVPWVAYGVAGFIGFSRIPLQSHFPSDVFAGAFLGYSISRFVVLHQH